MWRGEGKKRRGGGGDTRAIWRHFSVPLQICHLALFVFIDCLGALSARWGPWLFIASVTYAGTVEVRALNCQFVWMMAGSLKAPRGTRVALAQKREGEKKTKQNKRLGARISPPWQLTHSQRAGDVPLSGSLEEKKYKKKNSSHRLKRERCES